jgi:hypothetical protein
MKWFYISLAAVLLLSGCAYSDTPKGNETTPAITHGTAVLDSANYLVEDSRQILYLFRSHIQRI